MRVISNRIKILFFILFLSLSATIAGITLLSKQNKYIKTEAIITSVEIEYNVSPESNEYTVFVEYEVDGKKYNNQLGYYKDGYVEGKQIEIMYDPSNPDTITTADKGFATYLVIIGPAILIIGLLLMLRRR